ncbi:MAG: AEC family transporter [Lachnospiraceae bacterium]|nr:AEC family transporter [Lachnospiraceae bacterium]
MILFRQMLILFSLMLVGYCALRGKVLLEQAATPLSLLVTQIANPALILSASMESSFHVSMFQLLRIVGFSFLIYAVLIAVSRAVTMLFHGENQTIYELMLIFSNIGFMGIPLVKMVYGPKEFFYITVFQIPYDLLIYTYGVRRICGSGKSTSAADLLKSLVNPGSVAAVGAMLIYILSVPCHGLLYEPLRMLGSIAAPLSMMVIGASFYGTRLRELITDRGIVLFSVVKLLMLPLILILILWKAGVRTEMLHVCLIVFGTPVGSMVVMFTEQFKTGQKLSTECVAFTTLLSVFTIPLLQMILQFLHIF